MRNAGFSPTECKLFAGGNGSSLVEREEESEPPRWDGTRLFFPRSPITLPTTPKFPTEPPIYGLKQSPPPHPNDLCI